jgi:endonuclease IV
MSKPLQRLGAHVGAKWTTPEASVGCLRTSVSIGANTMQVFTKSNRSWQASDLSEEVASKFRDSLAASGLSEV